MYWGREVALVVERNLQPGLHLFRVETAAWPAGLYVYRVEAGEFTETRTMIKVQ